MWRVVGLLCTGLALLAGTGCDVLATAPPATPTPGIRATPTPQRATVQVKRGTIVDAIKVLGRVVSSREADLSFRNSGRIREVYVQPGDLVAAGQVLAELDQRDLPWSLAKAQVAVQQAQVRLAAAQAKDVVDDTAVDRMAIRTAQIALAQQELNVQRLQAGALPADVRKAEADVAARQAEADKARFDVADKQAAWTIKQTERVTKQQGAVPLAVIQAQADVEAARIKVEQLRAGPRVEDVRTAQIALDQERTKLDRLRDLPKVRAEEVANARVDVEVAQAKLTKVLADIDAGQIKEEQSLVIAVRTAQLELERAQNLYTAKAAAGDPTGEEIRQQELAVTSRSWSWPRCRTSPAYDLQAKLKWSWRQSRPA